MKRKEDRRGVLAVAGLWAGVLAVMGILNTLFPVLACYR